MRGFSTSPISQGLVKPHTLTNFFPGSVFVAELSNDRDLEPFDYGDAFAWEGFGTFGCFVRMDNIGVICIFGDNGTLQCDYSNFFDRFEGISMHPLQFIELATMSFYQEASRRVQFTYSVQMEPMGPIWTTLPPAVDSKDWYADWDMEEYAAFLEQQWKRYGFRPAGEFVHSNGRVVSILFDSNGNPVPSSTFEIRGA